MKRLKLQNEFRRSLSCNDIATSWIKIILKEGKNRQVRKMTAHVGFPTLRLIRYRIEEIELNDMKPGTMIELSQKSIYKKLFHASNYEVVDGMYHITTDISKLDVNVIHQFLSEESYWAKGIPKHVVEKSIANSLCFGLFYKNEQIGFARLVTDKATFAYLADVFILKEYRGKGLSKWLMKTIQSHPELQNLRRWLLDYKRCTWII